MFGRAPRVTDRHRKLVWQASSLLLAYPDEEHEARLALVSRVLGELPAGLAAPLAEAVTGLELLSAHEAAADYVETFDLRRKRSLFLTYWTDGDTRNRGNSMLLFANTYRDCGVEPPEGELPDHLAVVLEFGATVDVAGGLALLARHRAPLELLRLALAEMPSPYVGAVAAVLATVPEPHPDATRLEAQRLAEQGPPAESVGLRPYAVTIPVENVTASLRGPGSRTMNEAGAVR
ncbi:nitrate reductase molybdenum cofactor assembly chaperone [Rhodococcus sp. NPDC058514]|uniref:nitrate reductase molybdenum cofactor assembly chaperone n=1 Tax=unclassified Rhodococcus (in: high G+C Gram-positive bacteria) TaxID=192944 RepID=UPI00364A8F95